MIRLIFISLTFLVGVACSDKQEVSVCRWFERCGTNCGECDDGDPCTEDRCTDGTHCAHISLGDSCECTPNCGENGRLALTQAVSQGDGGLGGMDGLFAVEATRDGAHIYVAANKSQAVTLLVHENNQLRWADSFKVGPVEDLALSGGETLLFSAGYSGLTVFNRNKDTGQLTQNETFGSQLKGVAVGGEWVATTGNSQIQLYRMTASNPPLELVRTVSSDALAGVRNMVISGDARHLYAAAFDASIVTAWAIENNTLNLINELEGYRGLLNPDGLALAPNQQTLYVAGYCDHDVAVLSRDPSNGSLAYVTSIYDSFHVHKGCEMLREDDRSHPQADLEDEEAIQVMNPSTVAVSDDGSTLMIGFSAPSIQADFFGLTDGIITEIDTIAGSTAYLDRLGLGPQRAGGFSGFSPPRDNTQARHSIDAVSRAGFFWTTSSYTSSLTRLAVGQDPVVIQKGNGGIAHLPGAYTLNLSPDGRNLYVGPRHHDTLASFAVDPKTGALTELPSPAIPPVATGDVDQLIDKGAVGHVYVVRPNGEQVVATETRRGELHFLDRDTDTGVLSYRQGVVLPECDHVRPFPADVVSSPDGKSVYVADFQLKGPSCIYHYALDDDGSPKKMTKYSESWLEGIETFSQTSDGKHLYAASFKAQSVGHFLRDTASGELVAQKAVIRDDLEGVEIMGMAPDERHLYATSPVMHTIVAFEREPETGALTYIQTVKRSDDIPLKGVAGIVVSSDGSAVYVAARMDNAIVHFERLANGELKHSGTITGIPSLNWVNGLAMDSAGSFLYSAAVGANAVSVFKVLKDADDGCGGQCPK